MSQSQPISLIQTVRQDDIISRSTERKKLSKRTQYNDFDLLHINFYNIIEHNCRFLGGIPLHLVLGCYFTMLPVFILNFICRMIKRQKLNTMFQCLPCTKCSLQIHTAVAVRFILKKIAFYPMFPS